PTSSPSRVVVRGAFGCALLFPHRRHLVLHAVDLRADRLLRAEISPSPGRETAARGDGLAVGSRLVCDSARHRTRDLRLGRGVVMEPAKYQAWLAGAGSDEPMAQSGERLFATFSCNTCHGQRAPTLAGLYGRRVQLQDGRTLIADEDYIRESILNPSAKIT